MDVLTDYGEVDNSSVGDNITADDGYEADVELPLKNSQDSSLKRHNRIRGTPEIVRGNSNAHPALCSLAIDLLIYFANQ